MNAGGLHRPERKADIVNLREHLETLEAAEAALLKIGRLNMTELGESCGYAFLGGRLCAQAEAAQAAVMVVITGIRVHVPESRDVSAAR